MTKADPETLSRDDLALTAAFLIALAATLGALFIGGDQIVGDVGNRSENVSPNHSSAPSERFSHPNRNLACVRSRLTISA